MSDFKLKEAVTIARLMNETPIHVTQEQVDALYNDDLIIESVTLDEVINTHFEGLAIHQPLMLEAITSKRNRVEHTMKAFNRKFKGALSGTGIDSSEAEIGKPRIVAGFAVLAARIPTSDGQSVSIIFHAPDDDPSKILPDDTLIAFRFLLNKRDVTHVVAPSGGHDIALNQVVTALSNLVERNSAKFIKSLESKKQKAEEIKTYQDGIDAFESEKELLAADIEKTEEQIKSTTTRSANLKGLFDKQAAKNLKLREQLDSANKAKLKEEAQQQANGNYVSDKIVEVAKGMTKIDFTNWAKTNLQLDIDSAGELFDQAKAQISESSQKLATEKRDEVLENARNMVTSEFVSWAKEKLGMNAYDADVLLDNARKELESQFAQKMQEQNAFKLAKQIEVTLKERLGDSVEIVKASSQQIDRAEVNVKFGSREVHVTVNDLADKPYMYISGDISRTDFDNMLNFPQGTTELASDVMDKVASNVETIVEQLTPKKVDLSDLPEFGSNSSDVSGLYGAELTSVIRTAINKAVKERFSYPDKSFKISVRKGSSVSSVYVSVNHIPEELKVYSDEYLAIPESDHEEQRRYRDRQYTVEFAAVKSVIDSAVEQFIDRGEYDPYSDGGIDVNFYHNIDYGFLYKRLGEEQEAFNKQQSKDDEAQKEEAAKEVNNGEGVNYDSGMDYKQVAKAVRIAITTQAKDSASPFFGGKYSVTSGLSTNKPFVAITIKQTGQVDLFEVKTAAEELLRSYNKVTGSSIDDDVSMSFIPKVESDVKVEKLFWYGLRARPVMVGSVPNVQIEQTMTATEAKKKFSDVHENSVRHGAVAYAKALPDEDIKQYELVDLSKQPDDEVLQNDFVKQARELGAKVELVNGRYIALLGKERVIADAKDLDEVEALLEQVEDWVESQEQAPSTVDDGEEITQEPEQQPEIEPEPQPEIEPEQQPEIEPEPQPEQDPSTVDGVQEPEAEQQPEAEPESLSVIDKLKVAMTEESDPEKLIEVLEAAMNEVERTDQLDEYEPLLEQASDRVTELLEQQ